MLAKISWLVVCDAIVESTNHVWQKSIVMADNGIGQCAVLEAQDMSEINVERGEAKEPQSDNLCLVVSCRIWNIGGGSRD